MSLRIDVSHFFCKPKRSKELQRIEYKVNMVLAMQQEILRAVVKDPEEFKRLSEQLKGGADALQESIDANKPKEN